MQVDSTANSAPVQEGPQEAPNLDSIGASKYIGAARVVATWLDSYWHNCQVDRAVLDQKRPELEAWKLKAQESDERVYRLPGTDLFMRPAGRDRYPFVLVAPEVGEVSVTFNPLFTKAAARVRLYSHYLAAVDGLDQVAAAARGLVEQVFGVGSVLAEQPGEVHVAADVAGWGLQESDMGCFTCPAEADDTRVDWVRGLVHSVRWGKRGAAAMQAVIYNKSRELREQSPEKAYVPAAWRQGGWDGAGDVYRVEFRASREWLRLRNVEAAGDVDLGAIFAEGMAWLQLRESSADSNRSRWPVAGVWSTVLEQAVERFGQARQYVKEHLPNVALDRLISQAVGCIAGAGALLGVDDLGDLLAFARTYGEQKLEKKGRTFAGLVGSRRDRYLLPAV